MISMLSHPIHDKNQQKICSKQRFFTRALFAQDRRADPVHHDASLATELVNIQKTLENHHFLWVNPL